MNNIVRISIAAAAVIAVAVFGCSLPPSVNPSLVPTPTPTAALLPCVESSATPTANTSPELTWSPERATQDWPGALRLEPSGCTPLVTPTTCASSPGPCKPGARTGLLYTDPASDVSPMALAFVDIVRGEFSVPGCYSSQPCVAFEMTAPLPRQIPSPADDWIAYGIVVDSTGDGRPDMRYGVDNAFGGDEFRIWRVDLATGRTDVSACCQSGAMDASFPGTGAGPARGFVGPQSTGKLFLFYVWASVIRDGEIVATDYAPDFGWLQWLNPP